MSMLCYMSSVYVVWKYVLSIYVIISYVSKSVKTKKNTINNHDSVKPGLAIEGRVKIRGPLRGLPHTNVTLAELRKTLHDHKQALPMEIDDLKELEFRDEVELCYAS